MARYKLIDWLRQARNGEEIMRSVERRLVEQGYEPVPGTDEWVHKSVKDRL